MALKGDKPLFLPSQGESCREKGLGESCGGWECRSSFLHPGLLHRSCTGFVLPSGAPPQWNHSVGRKAVKDPKEGSEGPGVSRALLRSPRESQGEKNQERVQ